MLVLIKPKSFFHAGFYVTYTLSSNGLEPFIFWHQIKAKYCTEQKQLEKQLQIPVHGTMQTEEQKLMDSRVRKSNVLYWHTESSSISSVSI